MKNELKINKETLEIFWDESYKIEKLFWLAIQYNSRSFSDFVDEDLQEEECRKLFDMSIDDFIPLMIQEEIAQHLESINKLGFLAVVRYPHLSNFSLNEAGQPKSWTVYQSIQSEICVYGDSREELYENIKKEYKAHFEREFQYWRGTTINQIAAKEAA